MNRIAIIASVAILSGCATKDYGRIDTPNFGTMSCQALSREVAETHAFLDDVDRESQFDSRSVASFMLDFGIGNAIERQRAEDSAASRLADLQSERESQGCE